MLLILCNKTIIYLFCIIIRALLFIISTFVAVIKLCNIGNLWVLNKKIIQNSACTLILLLYLPRGT